MDWQICSVSQLFLYNFIPAATINIESAASPPNEGDGTGIAAVLRLNTNPTTTTLAENVAVSVTVMTGGSETATGKS